MIDDTARDAARDALLAILARHVDRGGVIPCLSVPGPERGCWTSDDDDRTDRDDAAGWLTEYLEDCGGSAPAQDVKRAARAIGIADRTLDRARARAGVTTSRQGFGRGAVYSWALPSCAPHVRHARQDMRAGAHGEHVAYMVDDVPPAEPPDEDADLWGVAS